MGTGMGIGTEIAVITMGGTSVAAIGDTTTIDQGSCCPTKGSVVFNL
jgi:hypothetical protein